MASPRPRFRRPLGVWILALGGALGLVARGLWPIAVVLAGALVVVLGGAWLVSPWNRTARNLIMPDLRTFDRRVARSRRLADAIGRVPIFGYLWRFSQRQTRTTVDRMIAKQRAIVAEEQGPLDDE